MLPPSVRNGVRMSTANKPATPLPWREATLEACRNVSVKNKGRTAIVQGMLIAYGERMERDRAKLVAALRDLMLRCDSEEGVRADGSNIQTIAASALLSELGEDK